MPATDAATIMTVIISRTPSFALHFHSTFVVAKPMTGASVMQGKCTVVATQLERKRGSFYDELVKVIVFL